MLAPRALGSRCAPFVNNLPLGPASLRRCLVAAAEAVRVDGGRSVQLVIEDVERLSAGYRRAIDLLAVGDPGLSAALHVVATLRHAGLAPAFTLASAGPRAVSSSASAAVSGTAALPGRVQAYRLALPPAEAAGGREGWRSPPSAAAWRPLGGEGTTVPLRVGNRTEILGLAKALAARAAVAPEGEAVLLETALDGEEKQRTWRVAKLARAVARAYGWETTPADASRPTRAFSCVAELALAEAAVGSAERWLLRLGVVPHGPPKSWGVDIAKSGAGSAE